jgi:Bacteriophage CI repressor helix-turn-helix domain.
MQREFSESLAMNFWGRVDNTQKALGITLQELCRKAQINYGTVMNKRSQGKLPNLEAAYAIAFVLKRSLDWLLTGNEAETKQGYVCNDEYLLPIVYKLSAANRRQLDAVSLILGVEDRG